MYSRPNGHRRLVQARSLELLARDMPWIHERVQDFFSRHAFQAPAGGVVFFHKQMKQKIPKLNFVDAISHMCWDARRKKGALKDSLDLLRKIAKCLVFIWLIGVLSSALQAIGSLI